ncbi:Cytochrome P450 81E8 [Vitis vinifera]|uniref:Cytochrome P450 81E8 n=1 Tax=Vitis vinifera TaxID=29760 RepID=A0A438FBU3_VITVI|nr:Cytochrome P450 81E8 [Vitis vinifera]
MARHISISSLSLVFFQCLPPKKNASPPPTKPACYSNSWSSPSPLETTNSLASTDSFSKYGPIFSLRFGSRLLVIISSPSTVEECFTKNDIIFANRPCFLFGKHIDYNYSTIASAPYGEHWRNLRRLSTLEIFSSNRLNMFLGIRRDEIKLLLSQLSRNSRDHFARVELRPMFIELTCNIIMRMVAGKRYYGEAVDFEEAKHFREVMRGIFELAGARNPGNFLLSLRWVYFGGYEKELVKINRMKEVIFQGLIDEHRSPTGLVNKNTMIDHLLSMQKSEPEYYTDEIIKGLALDLILAGTDTTATTIEWAMSLLLNHPDVLKKARVELDALVGKDRLMEESDFPKLQYLQNIISETLRLFPAAPLLVPHMSSENSQIGGFDIPRDTILLANVWAIHRDPKLWEDATSVKPERFENIGGTETYKLLPFGLGRRACPGVGLANRVVGLALGSLIQCYEWERVSEKEVDMAEGKGLTMPKMEPLEAMCKARAIIRKVF